MLYSKAFFYLYSSWNFLIIEAEVVEILIAKTKEGEFVQLIGRISKEDLKSMRKSLTFYCPQCQEQVLLKVGEFKIPHFAHVRHSTCQSFFSEGESAVHLAGKQQLYTFFQRHHLTVQLEPFLEKLSQRPDLLIETPTEQIPVEFQCSSISTSEIARRTAGYEKFSLKPIWILQTPKQLQQFPQGAMIYSLSRFEESFLIHSTMGQTLLFTYDAYSRKFHYVSFLMHIEGRKFIGNHRTLSLENQSFPFLLPKKLTKDELQHYYALYASSRLKFLRNRILYNRKGINDSFLRNCYQLRIVPSELPLWIGAPITFGMIFKEHNCEWQLALLNFIHKNKLKIDEVTAQDLYEFAYEYGNLDRLAILAFEKYIKLLIRLGITSVYDKLSEEEFREKLLDYLQSEVKIEKI